jgi:glycine/D-amino acid oxidase-like deaminating enzyme
MDMTGPPRPERLTPLKPREDPMRTHAQAVVIGGGVVGCSILYHLAKAGWTEVVLLERELTSGSTWHAAANIHGLHDVTNISRLQHYTMNLYKELEAETGQSCGVFQPGSLYLAQTEDREHQLRLQEAKARRYGMNFHEVSRDEAERLHPLVDFDGVRCIMFEPDGGNVDPSGVTNAYAMGARQRGAEIHRFTPVIGTEAQADGTWIVRTEKGDIATPWVVNAAGLWGREVAAMAGIDLPLLPTEHQYFVTETIAEIAAMDRRLPSVADRDGEYYLRQEGQGLLVGAYEKDVRFWAEDGTPQGFGHELFADDLERIEENMMRAIDRVPVVGEAGIKRVINGPMIWSPDSRAVRAGAGADGVFLLQRDHPGLLAKRRAGAARGRMDGGGGALARHVRLGPGAVRGLGGQGLYQGAGGRPVRASLQDPFPRRGTGGRAARAHATRLRDAEGDGREVRLELRLGTSCCSLTKTSRTAQGSRASPGGTWWAARRGCCGRMRASSTSRTSPSIASPGPGRRIG